MFNKRERQFRTALQRIFDSTDGKLILKYLKEDFVDRSCYSDNPHQAFYMLGQQDVVKGLINSLKDEDRDQLETLQVSSFDDL